ncbi:hypothetical protein GG344DRAFT_70744 [Lentinula edodes]|nr:hypothetical protein GG344DRAFT_70744 [Lentinula edodes]
MDLKLIRCRRIKAFHQIYRYHPGPLECMSGDEAGMDGKYYKTQVEWRLQELANFLALLSAWYMVATWIMASTIHLESFRIRGILRIGLTWSCKRTLRLYNYQSILDLRWVAVNSIELVFCDFTLTAVLIRQNTWLVRFQTTYGNFYHVTCSRRRCTSAFYISILKLSLSTLQLCFKTLLLERLLGHRFEKRIVRRMTLQDLALQTIRGSSCPRFLHDQTMPAHRTDRPKKRFHPYLRRGKFLRNRPDHGVQQQFHALAFFMFIGLILSLDGPALRLTTPRSLVYARFQCIENVGTFTSPLLLPERYKARPAPSFIDSML